MKWVKDTELFVKKRFGELFVSSNIHVDEKFCHLHFSLIPKVTDGRLDLTGLAAQRALKTSKKASKDQAYKEAMRVFQDEYLRLLVLKMVN